MRTVLRFVDRFFPGAKAVGENSAGSRRPRTALVYLANVITRLLPPKRLLSTEGVSVLVRRIPGFAFVPHHIVGADLRQLPSCDGR